MSDRKSQKEIFEDLKEHRETHHPSDRYRSKFTELYEEARYEALMEQEEKRIEREKNGRDNSPKKDD